MSAHHPALPLVWLLSDARNDGALANALADLPHGSGFVFRHYHLDLADRRARYDALMPLARNRNHLVILAGDDWRQARDWGADGIYGNRLDPSAAIPHDMLWLATARDQTELARANRNGANGIFLSPVHPTRSHPGTPPLGPVAFHRLAATSAAPVIALGGMTAALVRAMGWDRWGAIDGLSPPPQDS